MGNKEIFLKVIRLGLLTLTVVVLLSVPNSILAADNDLLNSILVDEIHLIIGELEQVKVENLTRVSVTDPEIADIVDALENEVLIVARAVGQTALFIWDDHGKRTIMIHVVKEKLETLKDRIGKLIKEAGLLKVELKENEGEGKIVLSGEVPEDKKELMEKILAPFSEDIINVTAQEKNEDLVQIDVQITELNTTLSKSLGIDWSTGEQEIDEDGRVTTTTEGNEFSPKYGEIMPPSDGSIGDFFKIGDFYRTTNSALLARVNALIEEGKGRVLSQPKLVAKSGQEASFLVGGEIPIRTTTSTSSGSTQENVEFKEYGIGMTITPTVKNDKIDILLNIEVSDVDSANAVGNDVAFITRNASTNLLLDDGQTMVLAGLIKQTEAETVRRVPFVSNIPIMGLLFRSRRTPAANQDQEMVISLTPHRIYQSKPKRNENNFASTATTFPKTSQYNRKKDIAIPDEMKDYVRELQQRISQAVVYPPEAQQYGWEGTVKVGLQILNDGTLAFAMVKESSGHEIFDDYALTTAKNVAPYATFPENTDLQEIKVIVPIVYSLNR